MAQEFNLIDQFFLPLSGSLQAGEVGIGDDGAVMTPPPNHQLVVVTDTMVSGVHFPVTTPADEVAWKAVAVNLSDLAAMGAKPAFISLGLTLPENDQAWLQSFAAGLRDICTRFKVPLIGGDTTKGPLTITVTAHGWVEQGRALLRSSAQAGDMIAVSGCLGDAGLGLKIALKQLNQNQQACLDSEQVSHCLNALNRPQPQIELGRLLQSFSCAAIDISDGLLADLGHILQQSNKHRTFTSSEQPNAAHTELGAEIYLDQLPLSRAMQSWFAQQTEWALPLAAGDDYQLCFSVAQSEWSRLQQLANEQGIKVTVVGRIVESQGVSVKPNSESDEVLSDFSFEGYQHF